MSAPKNQLAKAIASLQVSTKLSQALMDLGYHTLTPIQQQAIPPMLKGQDLIGQAQTGSGKTAAFAVPVLEKVNVERRRVQSLILCPTRELCTQVAREIRRLARYHAGLQVLLLCGGEPVGPQLGALEKGAHIVVGTPGRVGDLLTRKKLSLQHCGFLVLDEADRMLEMGFRDQLELIVDAVPPQRQTVLFSATFPDAIAGMSARYQRQALHVRIEDVKAAQPDIEQSYIQTNVEHKPRALAGLLQYMQPQTAIVFCNLKATVDGVTASLQEAGVDAAALHGDLEQFDRDRVLARFRNQSVRVLVASDVAARGIDVADLDLVVNYDLPGKPEVYVHRIGRTGRAGKSGHAVALITPREMYKIELIETATGQSFAPMTVPTVSVNRALAARMATLYLGAGRKDKLRPGDILGALTGDAGGLPAHEIGKIEIFDRYSYVATTRATVHHAMRSLAHGRIKGRKINVELIR